MIFKLFLAFLKVGAFTFGGGYAMIPLIENEIITKNAWLTMPEFIDLIATAEVTPGPIAVNSATFVGYRIAGFPGALAATTAVVLPSVITILIIARVLQVFKESKVVQSVLSGIRPAVVAMITSAAVSVGRSTNLDLAGFAIAVLVFYGIMIKRWHPILMLLCAGFLGILANVLSIV